MIGIEEARPSIITTRPVAQRPELINPASAAASVAALSSPVPVRNAAGDGASACPRNLRSLPGAKMDASTAIKGTLVAVLASVPSLLGLLSHYFGIWKPTRFKSSFSELSFDQLTLARVCCVLTMDFACFIWPCAFVVLLHHGSSKYNRMAVLAATRLPIP